jgi:hypothetical protein
LAASASLISSVEPPRGKDPNVHHTDVAANLIAVAQALQSSGSGLPKALAAHTESLKDIPAAVNLGSNPPAPMNALDARGSSAPLINVRPGNSVIFEVKVTPSFLAAAADKFYSMSAEELVVTISTIVPNFAACRRLWLESNFSGSYLVLSENPQSLMEKLQAWKRPSGEFLLTGNEIEAVIALLARIMNQCTGKPPMSAPWIAMIPDVIIMEHVPPFSTLTSVQTFEFVLLELPHLTWLRQAWELHGLTGRELLAMHPQLLIEVLNSFHELVPGQQRLSAQQCDRIRQAILIALRRYAKSDDGVDAVIEEHEAFHSQIVRKYSVAGGAQASHVTPQHKQLSPIQISSGSEGGLTLNESATGDRLKLPGRPDKDALFGVPKMPELPKAAPKGDTSFMEQFGASRSGTQLYSATGDTSVIGIGTGNIFVQHQAPVQSEYKMFDTYSHDGWAVFIKQYRDETVRLPKVSRRPIKDLVKPAVIEQLREEMDLDVDAWHDLPDTLMLEHCFARFGPKTAREAKARLEATDMYFNDATMHQSTWLPKLVKFFAEKLVMLADFEHAAKFWSDGDKFTNHQQSEAMIKMFPIDEMTMGPDEKTKVKKSSNNVTVRELVRENKNTPFRDLAKIIKDYFRKRDDQIAACPGSVYTVTPWIKSASESNPNRKIARETSQGNASSKRKFGEIKGGIAKKPAPKHDAKGKGPRCNNCGKYGHKANAEECVLWGHQKARGAKGTWEEGEKALHLDPPDYTKWCEDNKDRVEKINAKKKAQKGKTPAKVNPRQCPRNARTAERANEHLSKRKLGDRTTKRNVGNIEGPNTAQAFHAVGRFERLQPGRVARTANVLMDPGAELNLIRADVLKGASKKSSLKVLDTRHNPTDLFNNGVKIGHVKTEHLLTFALDTLDGVATVTYTEWFHEWNDLEEDAILGAEFNRQQCFTNYHTRLVPYSSLLPKRKAAVVASTAPADANALAGKGLVAQWDLEHRPREEFMPGQERGTNLQDREPDARQRRIQQRCEADECLKKKHARSSVEALTHRSQHPWMCRQIVRPAKFQSLTLSDRRNHTRVDYNKIECQQLAAHLTRSHCEKQQNLLKKLTPYGQQQNMLTAEEHEVIADAARACALEAADFYECNRHLLGKNASRPSARTARYFMDEPVAKAPAVAEPESNDTGQKFPNRHVCVLQNLQNKAELNGKAVRIIEYDAEQKHYVIGIANPRSYWTCKEEYLRTLDPEPEKPHGRDTRHPKSANEPNLSFADCGVDAESGQPTLDPLQRPVHRQFGKEFSPELTARINAILEKYKDVFGKDISQPCKFRPMKIDLIPNGILPANPRYWRNSPEQRKEVRTQLQSMIDMKIVRASDTAVVSNVLLVKRPGMPGKFRFTVDMRTLNDATVPMPWQMPDVQQQLDRLQGNNVFGCIDLSSYYHQIELDKGSRFLTGFITEDGVFEYNRVAMGLKNACAHAQSCLQKAIDDDPILRKYNVRNYFDDIPLAAKSADEFCELLEAILAMGMSHGLKFNLEKSIFGVDSITHVGFVVREGGVEVDPMRVEALQQIVAPKSMKGTQSVLGAWNYIRNFIPNFSSRALPLTDLIGSVKGANGKKKPKPFVWTDQCQAAFDDLKQATLDTSLLANIDFSKEIFIRCDSSQFGAGAVIFQLDDQGRECPIAYASRKYTSAERNYCTFQQEAGAVVWALEKFACFFQGHAVTVQSDHKNLSWVKKSAMPQLTRWRLRLQDFDFRLEYLPGPLNICADGLSRIHVDDTDMLISMADILPAHAAEQSLLAGKHIPHRALNSMYRGSYRRREPQRSKPNAELVWHHSSDDEAENLETGQRQANVHPIGASASAHAAESSEDEGLPVAPNNDQPAEPAIEAGEVPAIPAIDADEIIHGVHNDIVGHAGVLTTLQRILRSNKQWASRSQMIADIDAFLSGCVTCQKFRKRHNRNKDQRFHIAGSPFSELSVDVLQLPRRDCNNNQYVVVIIDSFSRWVQCVPVADKSALSAARALIQCIGNFGMPLTIRSDGGGEFINATLAAFEAIVGVKHHKITPYLHEGNSLAEKANRSVLENLRNLMFDKRLDLNGEHQWSDLLPLAQRILNASFNSSIGCSPAQLVFGDNLELDRCLLTAMPPAVSDDAPEYIRQLAHNQRTLFDKASQSLDATHAKNLKKWKAEHTTDVTLQQKLQENVEEGVWVLARIRDDAPVEKWKPRWAGPFRLLDFKSQTQSIVRLWDTVENKVIEAHLNDVELWNHKFVDSTEGLTKVAEYDGWQYPMDGITGMALTPADADEEPVPLDLTQARTKANKYSYSFCVKWRNYEETSWVKYNAVKDTSTFMVWAAAHPVLKF